LCHLKLLHSSRGVSKGEFLIHSWPVETQIPAINWNLENSWGR
jgi:hypothetical protein